MAVQAMPTEVLHQEDLRHGNVVQPELLPHGSAHPKVVLLPGNSSAHTMTTAMAEATMRLLPPEDHHRGLAEVAGARLHGSNSSSSQPTEAMAPQEPTNMADMASKATMRLHLRLLLNTHHRLLHHLRETFLRHHLPNEPGEPRQASQDRPIHDGCTNWQVSFLN